MRRRIAVVLAALSVVAGAIPFLPSRSAHAYVLECCPFPRSWVPKLVAAVRPGYHIDNSSWFTSAVAAGFNGWNNTPTPIYVSVNFSTASSYQIQYWSTVATSGDSGPSYARCVNTANTSSGTVCTLAEMDLYEGCVGNTCNMESGSPNYDMSNVAHEEGHDLGLDHTCKVYQLMSASGQQNCPDTDYSCYSENNCITTPQQDDIDGAESMYGNNSYQYGGGSGCSNTKFPTLNLPTPEPSAPAAGIDWVPTTPTPLAQVGAAQEEVQSAEQNPVGAAETGVNEGLAATGKVVPYSSLPNPGSVTLPDGLGTVNRPC